MDPPNVGGFPLLRSRGRFLPQASTVTDGAQAEATKIGPTNSHMLHIWNIYILYPKNCQNVGKYSIHGAYGIWIFRVLISKTTNYIKLLLFFFFFRMIYRIFPDHCRYIYKCSHPSSEVDHTNAGS